MGVKIDWTENYRYAAILLDASDVFLTYGMSMAAADARWLAGELIARADANTMSSRPKPTDQDQ